MDKREQRRMAMEVIRMAPTGIIYTLAEAMELARYGTPWNLAWYINGGPGDGDTWEDNYVTLQLQGTRI